MSRPADTGENHASWKTVLGPLLLLVAVTAAYANSIHGVFLFDDLYHIVENERIRRLWPLAPLLNVERPVVELSLAVNYALGGFEPRGYHLFNIAVHALAALTLLGVARRTFALEAFPDPIRRRPHLLAWLIAAIWAVHPLTTQSVTYIIQRGESLMGMLYLLTFYCAIRARNSHRQVLWTLAAVVACAMGMASKAIMVTAPVMVIMYDVVFRTHTATPRNRWPLYTGLIATWAVLWICGIAIQVFDPTAPSVNVGFGYHKIAPLEYLITQPGVILWYLRLSLWPVGLCLDYDWPVVTLREALFPSLLVIALLGGTVWALIRRKPVGFAGAWFFLILAPTSSFIPIEDPIFEHRMYLPLIAVIAVVVLGACHLARRVIDAAPIGRFASLGVACCVVLALSYGTFQRNKTYASDLTMWSDVVAKRPTNARAHVALGNALLDRDRVADAIASFRRAVELRPDFADARVALGMALARQGLVSEAIEQYRIGLQREPNHARGWYNLGNALGRLGQVDESIDAHRKSLELRPRFGDAHCNLGNALVRRGRLDEAIAEYHIAIDIDPTVARYHNNLGDALRQLNRLDEAIAAFKQAVALDPAYANAHANLAAAYLDNRQAHLAAPHAQEALRLDPNHPTARALLEEAGQRTRVSP